jgi:tRNA threonylcarbamoyladenosine biosynthesis protein TsaE
MSAAHQYSSPSTERTLEIGAAVGSLLRGGDFLALSGELGAGKTHLIKGIASGVGVPTGEPVVSPTFVLVREYAGRLKLYHLDAYRLSDAAELFEIGLEEMLCEPDAIVALEWADRVPEAIPDAACHIHLAHAGPSTREIHFAWSDPRLVTLAESCPP